MSEPVWLQIARQDLGLREIKGAPTAPKIAGWLASLGAWWRDDETPWCGTAVAAWMRASLVDVPKAWYRARAWLDWGSPVVPCAGAVAVFERGGGGHVGIVVGRDRLGRLLVLGGNQGDAVSIAPFARERLLGCRWPLSQIASYRADNLPEVASSAPSSTNEA